MSTNDNGGTPTTPPAPALPAEVREAIDRATWPVLPSRQAGLVVDKLVAALAPVVQRLKEAEAAIARKDKVIAVNLRHSVEFKQEAERDLALYQAEYARAEAAERKLEEMTGWRNECGFRYNQAKAERDQHASELAQARAEIVRLEKNLYTGDDDEKRDLRADIDRLNAEVAVLEGQLAASEKQLAAAQAQAREAMEDKERLDWLSTQCYLPGDHPDDGVMVVVSEKFAPLGSFTLSAKHDAAALRVAIDRARNGGAQ